MEGIGCAPKVHWGPKCSAVALGAATSQDPHHLGDLSWLAVVSPAENSSGTRQGLAQQQRPSVWLDTKTTLKAQHTLGSHAGTWNPWRCWASAGNAGLPGEECGNAPPSPEPQLNWGQTQLFPHLPCPWHSRAVVLGGHVLESLCQGSGAWPGLFLAPSWCLAEAGSWFWRALGFGGL